MNEKKLNEFTLSLVAFIFLILLTVAIFIWGESTRRKAIDKDENGIHLVLERKIPRF